MNTQDKYTIETMPSLSEARAMAGHARAAETILLARAIKNKARSMMSSISGRMSGRLSGPSQAMTTC